MKKFALNDEILLNIEKPARYIGGEINEIIKEKEHMAVRFAICFPDVYEIGMSHLGIQILYAMFNSFEDTYCERVYCPWPDLDQIMRERGIPVVVWLSPVLPFINDTEENITEILNECIRIDVKGIINFGMGLTLREGDREYYYTALDRHFPGMKEQYIRRYGNVYELPSPKAKQLTETFHRICRDNDILSSPDECFRYINELPEKNQQMSIFDAYDEEPE